MPAWDDLLNKLNALPANERGNWIFEQLAGALSQIGALRGNRNVIFYGSAFLQKPGAPPLTTMITAEDLNGLMAVIYKMDCSKGLTLVLHTPGGVTTAAESVVAYLRSKFDDIEVIVPAFAMSAGTMIALAADRIIMGRQSQLGPIDPQLGLPNGRSVSAQSVVDQFEKARADVLADQRAAHVWAPIVQSMGPSLLQEAQNQLDYSERMVAGWLDQWMLSDSRNTEPGKVRSSGQDLAHYFIDAGEHKNHGRRIGRDEARGKGTVIEDLECDQSLQEAVLTAYHVATLLFEQSPTVRILVSDSKRTWIKNHAVQKTS